PPLASTPFPYTTLFRSRDLPGAPPRSCERRLGELRLRPLGVRDLEVRRQAAHVAPVDRRQVAADSHRASPVVAREVELRQPGERSEEHTSELQSPDHLV